MPWWCEFPNSRPGCITGCPRGQVEARAKAMRGEWPSEVSVLPYPAPPVLYAGDDSCPAFCFRPGECKGESSCPRNPACSE